MLPEGREEAFLEELADTGDEMYRTSDGRYFNPSLFRIDRIHLNKKGHDVWTGLMKEKLAELGV